MNNTFIDFEKIESNLNSYASSYKEASPFELLIIDDFLTPWGLNELNIAKLSSLASSKEKSSDYFFAKEKIENPNLSKISGSLSSLKDELLSDRFRYFINKVTGQNLFLDDKFVGGGLHQGGPGSFLEMHADFSRHPVNHDWIRELNLLLYLNPNWKKEYGGELDLYNALDGRKLSIEPIENRFVIMLTKEHTVHGYKKINFPENTFRTSIAAYAYKLDDGTDNVPYRSTTWHPSDFRKSTAAKFLNKIVPIKQKIFGSRTAKRSED